MLAPFLSILGASITGSIMIAAVLLLRPFLKRAGKQASCLLWILVLARLLIPFAPESPLSLQPDKGYVYLITHPTSGVYTLEAYQGSDLIYVETAYYDSIYDVPGFIGHSSDPGRVIAWVWAGIACGMLLYTLCYYLLLKFRVRHAIKIDHGVWESERIDAAFLLGYLAPKIYLPAGMDEDNKPFIIAHERAHLARLDNWLKLLGFLCLSLHWFNPLVWLMYVLLSRDIEMACDERVIRSLELPARKAYSTALLSCSARNHRISACPVAFAEVSVKQRIVQVLRYRKPGFWLKILAGAAVIFTAVCFMTNPVSAQALEPEIPASTVPTEPAATFPTEPPATVPATEPAAEPVTEPTAAPTVPPEAEHVHAFSVTTRAPSCTLDGYDLFTCGCGESYRDNIVAATGHAYHEVKVVEASFDTEGYTDFQCALCGDTERGNYVAQWEKVDNAAAVAAAESYARTLGFRIRSSGRANVPGLVATAFPYHSGGQDHLVLLIKNAIRSKLADLRAEGTDPADYELWIWLEPGTVTTIHICTERLV